MCGCLLYNTHFRVLYSRRCSVVQPTRVSSAQCGRRRACQAYMSPVVPHTPKPKIGHVLAPNFPCFPLSMSLSSFAATVCAFSPSSHPTSTSTSSPFVQPQHQASSSPTFIVIANILHSLHRPTSISSCACSFVLLADNIMCVPSYACAVCRPFPLSH